MKKCRSLKMMVLVLCMMLLCSFVPTAYAATSITLDAEKDILPGGIDVGYSDNSAAGGSVRGLEVHNSFGVCLRNKEWLKYSISNLSPGQYQLVFHKSSTNPVSVKVTVNDTVAIEGATLRTTGSYSAMRDIVVGNINITEPRSVLTIENISSNAMYITDIKLTDAESIERRNAFLSQSRAYMMSYLPCVVEAENFDSGVSGVAYSDSDPGNLGGAYRVESDVDIYSKSSEYYVNMTTGDWMSYTVRCDNPGNYDLILNIADLSETSKVRAYMDGYEILRLVPDESMPIGDMQEAVAGTFYIEKGVHTFRLKCVDGDVNLDYMRFRKSSANGVDTTDVSKLRTWEESQELSDEDYEVETEAVANPVEREIYVDSSAKTGGNGTKEAPFATIEEAKEYVKTVNTNMKGDIVVNLKGEFKLDKTIEFNEKDSGEGIYNVIYRGDGDTVVHGGTKITGWKQAGASPLWQVTLPDETGFRQFYVGDNRAITAKSDWLYWMVAPYDDPETDYTNAEGFFINAADFPQGFSKSEDMEMIWMTSWRWVDAPIDSITDMGDGTMLVKYPQPYFNRLHSSSAPINIKIPYYLQNAPEFLDKPGEFYFDKDTKVLTYYPFSYEDMTTIDCYIPKTEFLIKVSGTDGNSKVKNITFEGIDFKYGAWNRTTEKGFATRQADEMMIPQSEGGSMLLPAQIQVDFAQNINFYKNEFSHLGSAALSFNNKTSSCKAEGNLFDDLSATAITVGDWNISNSNPVEDYTRKITIRNNLIRRPSVEYMTPIITGYYVNNIVVDHNDILDAPYSGISMGWGWGKNNPHSSYNRMTNNKIENVTYKLMDGGHIYTLDPMKGGVISGNYLIKSGEWKGGIYHDNASAFIRTFNNVFEECTKWYKLTWSNLHDNIAYNNYSERPHVNLYPDMNTTEPAKGKVNGEWPEEAKAIIANAGLQEKYQYLLDDYNNMANLRNATLERQKFQTAPGIFIEAGDYMEGGEGVGYHDTNVVEPAGRSLAGEPDVYESYDGTLLHYVMTTAQGEWTKHKFTVEEAGEYEIFANLSVVQQSTAVSVEIDDKLVADKVVLEPNCKNYSVFTDYNVGKVYLEPGEHIIKVEHAVNNFGFKSVRLAKVGEKFNRNDGFKPELLKVILSK